MKPVSRALLFIVGAMGTLAFAWFLLISFAFGTLSDPSLPSAERRQLFLDGIFRNGPMFCLFGYLPLTACLFLCVKAVANPPTFFRRSDLHLLSSSLIAAAIMLLMLVPFLLGFG